ncbi:MAG: hypothetical protein SAL07_22280 [Oscillatoria sp. PMC 1051.18]|nr:hypothetical protein [Oscillatoria sp. PMC 1050.18]MEC5032637.1 hypothetical protein [Oscillatoria sp. PMC 1051.18]
MVGRFASTGRYVRFDEVLSGYGYRGALRQPLAIASDSVQNHLFPSAN